MTLPADTRREIRGYHAVRDAAKDTERYSSALSGDRDVRDYRQIPLELDPPRHTLWRAALQPMFLSSAIEPLRPRFAQLAREVIDDVTARGGGDAPRDIALRYVIGCLAIIYGRPQDAEEWASWGPDVWLARAYAAGEVTPESVRAHRERRFDVPSQRSGDILHAYLDRVFAEADARAEQGLDAVDLWDTITRLEVDGARPDRDEKRGIASVLLAGGRDTVIKVVTGIVWHLVNVPADRKLLQDDPTMRARAVAELIRYLTPLAKMERIERDEAGTERGYVLLGYASANHDPEVWDAPERVDIHRERRPHLSFGAGRHSCLGMSIADHETRVFLDVLLEAWPGWEFDGEPDIEWTSEGPDGREALLERFNAIPLRVAN